MKVKTGAGESSLAALGQDYLRLDLRPDLRLERGLIGVRFTAGNPEGTFDSIYLRFLALVQVVLLAGLKIYDIITHVLTCLLHAATSLARTGLPHQIVFALLQLSY
jgi:hypothetical protein